MKAYYIFGLQRTGTYWLEKTWTANFFQSQCSNREFGIWANKSLPWKHLVEPENANFEPDIPSLVIIKNPYTWIESIIFRNPVDFFETQSLYEQYKTPEDILVRGISVDALAKIWNRFYMHWVFQKHESICYDNIFIFRFEDLINPKVNANLVRMAYKKLGFEPEREEILKTHSWVKPDDIFFWPPLSIDKDYDVNSERYYVEERPKQLTAAQTARITETLHTYTMIKMGYQPL